LLAVLFIELAHFSTVTPGEVWFDQNPKGEILGIIGTELFEGQMPFPSPSQSKPKNYIVQCVASQ